MVMGSDAIQVRDAAPSYGVEACVDDVPPGYKRSEMGVFPADWEIRRLGDHVRFLRHGVNARAELSMTGSVRYLHYGDIHTSTDVRLNPRSSSMPYLPTDRAGALDRLQNGDLVLVDASEDLDGVGKSVEITGISDEEVVSGLHTIAARFDKSILADGFKAYLQFCPPFRDHLKRLAAGTKVYSTNRSHIATVEMPLPSVGEQRAIAEALSGVDGLLGALEALIAKKRAIKQAAMQQRLTGKTRLPGFSGAWETKRLGEIGYFLKGSGITRDDAQSGHLACVRYGEIYTMHHDYIREFNSWISPAVAATATRLEYGDLLFAGSGETKEEIGKCVALVLDDEAYAGGDIVILRPKNVDSLFFGYALNMPDVARQKASFGQGDAVVHISGTALAQVSLLVPSIAEQTAIATVLSDMDAEIAALEARRDKTRALKQGMMQQLLTGRVRLVKPEVEPAC